MSLPAAAANTNTADPDSHQEEERAEEDAVGLRVGDISSDRRQVAVVGGNQDDSQGG